MVRSYCIGACLFDKAGPSRVLARTTEPLLTPSARERGGYGLNVIYSCGPLLHDRRLLLPYAVADQYTPRGGHRQRPAVDHGARLQPTQPGEPVASGKRRIDEAALARFSELARNQMLNKTQFRRADLRMFVSKIDVDDGTNTIAGTTVALEAALAADHGGRPPAVTRLTGNGAPWKIELGTQIIGQFMLTDANLKSRRSDRRARGL